MARPKKTLDLSEREQILQLWKDGGGVIDYVADQLSVTWQTARRWLILCGIQLGNDRLDRPGLKWPKYRVQIWDRVSDDDLTDELFDIVVEAPNWAVAIEMLIQVHHVDDLSPWTGMIEVSRSDLPVTKGYDRQSVKTTVQDLSKNAVQDLCRKFAPLGVKR